MNPFKELQKRPITPKTGKKSKTSDKKSMFMPIWEIETHFRCPVIGAILSVEKHRQILNKSGIDTTKMQPYEYHQKLMSKLCEKNKVSIKVNNFLISKAKKYMNAIKGKAEKEIRKLWIEQSLKGNVGPLLFAIVSYSESSLEMLHDVYGEVHMQAHANMTEVYDMRKKITLSEKNIHAEKNKNQRKRKEIKQLVQINKSSQQKIQRLEKDNFELIRKVKRLEEQRVFDQGLPKTVENLKLYIRELEARLEQKDEKIRIKNREKKSLEVNLYTVQRDKELFEDQIKTMIDGFDALGSESSMDLKECNDTECLCDNFSKEKCEQYQLCEKRVFMVGGMTKMKHHYKNIVEKAGGHFDYHDGYLKNRSTNLEARVKRSDIVICPVDCNSHNACLKVKKLCNQYNKKLKLLSSSSLSTITQALFNNEHKTILN